MITWKHLAASSISVDESLDLRDLGALSAMGRFINLHATNRQHRHVSRLRVADFTAERVRHEHVNSWFTRLYEPLGVSKGQHTRHRSAFEDPCTAKAPVLLRGGMTQHFRVRARHFSGFPTTTINSHLLHGTSCPWVTSAHKR